MWRERETLHDLMPLMRATLRISIRCNDRQENRNTLEIMIDHFSSFRGENNTLPEGHVCDDPIFDLVHI